MGLIRPLAVEIGQYGPDDAATPEDGFVPIPAVAPQAPQSLAHLVVADRVEGKAGTSGNDGRQQQIGLVRNQDEADARRRFF